MPEPVENNPPVTAVEPKPDAVHEPDQMKMPKYRRTLASQPHEDEDELQRKLLERSEHEAAHVILNHEYGWETKRVSVGFKEEQKAVPDFHGDDAYLSAPYHGNPKQKQLILNYCDVLVAGHLAENEGRFPDVKKVSDRITDEMLAKGEFGKEDHNKVCYFLKKIGCNTKQHVLDAEARARKKLHERKAHHRALADALYDNDALEWSQIKKLIGG